MKTALFLLIISSMSLAQSVDKPQISSGNLVVGITGIENNNGMIMVALCNSEENFTNTDSSFRSTRTGIENGRAFVEFTTIPFGQYAVKVFHDENGNEELDTNFIGIPIEDYGFSNNSRGSFGPPSWEDSRFVFNQAVDSIYIQID